MTKKQYSYQMQDYLRQLDIILKAIDKIMTSCGLIYPAVKFLMDAKEDIIEAIKQQALRDLGVIEELKKKIDESTTNYYWNWNKEFEEWRKERKGIVNSKREEK